MLSVEAFEMWHGSKDPSLDQLGKGEKKIFFLLEIFVAKCCFNFVGVAVCSTRQFFTKLAEDKDDDEGDFYAEEGETL